MHPSLTRVATATVVALLVVACTSAPSPAPSVTPAASSGPPRSSTAATSKPTDVPDAFPSARSTNLGIHGSARELAERVRMAPAPGGSLYVSIPQAGGSVLALLDRSGRARPGWPITVKDSSECGLVLTAADGSVRAVCNATDLPLPELEAPDVRAFAFDVGGRLMPGWPVQLRPGVTGRVIGNDLTLLVREALTDTPETGQVSSKAWMAIVAADGSLRRGKEVPMVETCCGAIWSVGADGGAYAVETLRESSAGAGEANRIAAIDESGVREGWPEVFDGTSSAPAIGPDGRIVLSVASIPQGTSRLLSFANGEAGALAGSPELRIATAEYVTTGGCSEGRPQPPLVAADGTTFLYSGLDDAVFAFDPALEVMPGWPYRTATPLVRPDSRYVKEDAFCPGFTAPTLGPDGTLYLPLQARDATAGGSLMAVNPGGEVAIGWSVELKRPGSEFWAVVVGPGGTAFALAVEAESSTTSSASILGISPDSTVVYRTTIIDP